MLKMYVWFKSLVSSKKGQGMVEYGLIIGLVALAVIVLLTTMGDQIGDMFDRAADAITAAGT